MKKTSTKKSPQKKEVKEEISAEVSETEELEKKVEEEPKWYHYATVLGVLVLLFFAVYFGFNYYSSQKSIDLNLSDGPETYLFEYERGNITYNIYFSRPVDELVKMDLSSQPSKEEVLVTKDFVFALETYNGTDNGQVTKAAVKLMRFFETVYRYDFGASNVVSFENVTCANSTKDIKVVTFNPYAKEGRNGVFFSNADNCLEFVTDEASKQEALVDYFIYRLLTRE
jgi:hypothetical protein